MQPCRMNSFSLLISRLLILGIKTTNKTTNIRLPAASPVSWSTPRKLATIIQPELPNIKLNGRREKQPKTKNYSEQRIKGRLSFNPEKFFVLKRSAASSKVRTKFAQKGMKSRRVKTAPNFPPPGLPTREGAICAVVTL